MKKIFVLLTALFVFISAFFASGAALAANDDEDDYPGMNAGAYAFEIDIALIANDLRNKAGVRALEIDDNLMAMAAFRASELEREFDHVRPDGSHRDTLLKEFNLSDYGTVENILSNMSVDPYDAMEQWMNSPGHRENILDGNYTHTGVGVHRSGGRTYVVQLFVER